MRAVAEQIALAREPRDRAVPQRHVEGVAVDAPPRLVDLHLGVGVRNLPRQQAMGAVGEGAAQQSVVDGHVMLEGAQPGGATPARRTAPSSGSCVPPPRQPSAPAWPHPAMAQSRRQCDRVRNRADAPRGRAHCRVRRSGDRQASRCVVTCRAVSDLRQRRRCEAAPPRGCATGA